MASNWRDVNKGDSNVTAPKINTKAKNWRDAVGATPTDTESIRVKPYSITPPQINMMPDSSTASFSARKALSTRTGREDVDPKNPDVVTAPTMPGSNTDYWEKGMPKTASNQNKPGESKVDFGQLFSDIVSQSKASIFNNVTGPLLNRVGSQINQNTQKQMEELKVVNERIKERGGKVNPIFEVPESYQDGLGKHLNDIADYNYAKGEKYNRINENNPEWYNQILSAQDSVAMMAGNAALGYAMGVPTSEMGVNSLTGNAILKATASMPPAVLMGLESGQVSYNDMIKQRDATQKMLDDALKSGQITKAQYDEAAKNYIYSDNEIGFRATTSGAIETLSEYLLGGKQLKAIALGRWKDILAKEGEEAAEKYMAKTFGDKMWHILKKEFIPEIAQEEATDLVHMGIDATTNAVMGRGFDNDLQGTALDNAKQLGWTAFGTALMVGEGQAGGALANKISGPKTIADIPGLGQTEILQDNGNSVVIQDESGQVEEVRKTFLQNAEVQEMNVNPAQSEQAQPELSDDEKIEKALEQITNVQADYKTGKIETKDYLNKLAEIDSKLYGEESKTSQEPLEAKKDVRLPNIPKTQNKGITEALTSEEGQATLNKIKQDMKNQGIDANFEIIKGGTGFHKDIQKVMKSLGVEVVFYKGDKVPNGFISNSVKNTIFIHSSGERNDMVATTGHEFLHHVKKTYAGEYKELLNFAKTYFTKEAKENFLKTYSNVPELQHSLANDENSLLEEMLADEMGNNFMDKNFWQRVYEHSKELFEKLVEVAQKIVKNFSSSDKYETYVAKETAETLSKKFEETIASVRKQVAEGKVDTEARILEENGIQLSKEKDSLAPISYNIRTYTIEAKKKIVELAEKNHIAEAEETYQYLKALDNVMAAIIADADRLDYEESSVYKALKNNSDPHYKESVDFTTLCRKRIILQGTIEKIQSMLGRGLTQDEWIDTRRELNSQGIEVSCGACYVDTRRMEMGLRANQYIEKNINQKQWYAHDKIKKNIPYPEKLPPKSWFYTQEGLDKMKEEYPEIYTDFNSKTGARGIKAPESRTAYRGEVLNMLQARVDALNSKAGLRWQSWSDFEVPHLLDGMQVIADMFAKGLKGHAYTKVENFVRAFGKTGMMINMSLIPKGKGLDADGNFSFDSKEGMPFETTLKYRDMFPNTVGNITIGVNDDFIRATLRDDRIDYTIPYHASGLSLAKRTALGIGMEEWDDYTNFQNPLIKEMWDKAGEDAFTKPSKELKKYAKTFKGNLPDLYDMWDYTKSPQQNVLNYTNELNKLGAVPPFPQFSNEPDYWKVLIDRKMVNQLTGENIIQQAVKPEFDEDVLQNILSEYKGEHNEEQYHSPTVDKLVEQFSKRTRSTTNSKLTMKDATKNDTKLSTRSKEFKVTSSMDYIKDEMLKPDTVIKVHGYRGRAKEDGYSNAARYGKAKYYSNMYGVAETWMKSRGDGATIEEKDIELKKPFIDSYDVQLSKTDKESLYGELKNIGLTEVQINLAFDSERAWNRGKWNSPFEALAGLYKRNGNDDGNFYSGATVISDVLKKLGFDGVVGELRSEGTLEFAVFPQEETKFSTRSKQFKDWFADSKVTDSENNPLIVYHGTNSDENFNTFQTYSDSEPGTHFGSVEAANTFGDRVYPVYLSIQNPLEVDDIFSSATSMYRGLKDMVFNGKLPNNEAWSNITDLHEESRQITRKSGRESAKENNKNLMKAMVDYVKSLGYDGFKYQNEVEDENSTSWVAFEPNQVKSAIGNNGEYSNENPDIRFAAREKETANEFDKKLNGFYKANRISGEQKKNITQVIQENRGNIKDVFYHPSGGTVQIQLDMPEEINGKLISSYYVDYNSKIRPGTGKNYDMRDMDWKRFNYDFSQDTSPDDLSNTIRRHGRIIKFNNKAERALYEYNDQGNKNSNIDEYLLDSIGSRLKSKYANWEVFSTFYKDAVNASFFNTKGIVKAPRAEEVFENVLKMAEADEKAEEERKAVESQKNLKNSLRVVKGSAENKQNNGLKHTLSVREKERRHYSKQYNGSDAMDDEVFKRISDSAKFIDERMSIRSVAEEADKRVKADPQKYIDKVRDSASFASPEDVAEAEIVLLMVQKAAQEYDAQGDKTRAEQKYNLAASIASKIITHFTNTARTLNMGKLWRMLDPQGVKRLAENMIEKASTDSDKKRVAREVKELLKAINQLDDSGLSKIKEALGFDKDSPVTAEEVLEEAEYNRDSNFDEVDERVKEVADIFDAIEKKNARKIADTVKKSIKSVLEGIDFGIKFMARGLELNSSESINDKIARLTEEYYSKPLSERGNLARILAKELNITMAQADTIATRINDKMKEVTREEKIKALKGEENSEAKKNAIERWLTPKMRKDPVIKSWVDRIVELSESGALTNEDLKPLVAAKYGIKVMTPDISRTLEQMSKEIKDLTKGSREYNIKVNALNDYMNSLTGHDFWEYLNAYEKLSLLSGSRSGVRNITGNLRRSLDYNIEKFEMALGDFIMTKASIGLGKITKGKLGDVNAKREVLMPRVIKQIVAGVKGEVNEIKDVVRLKEVNSRPVEDSREYASYVKFKNPVMQVWQRWVRLLVSDRAFNDSVIADAMHEAKKLAEINGLEFDEDIAMEEAQKIANETFFNGDDEVIKRLMNIRREGNFGKSRAWGLGTGLLAFLKVPYNVSKFAIEREWHIALSKLVFKSVRTGYLKARGREEGKSSYMKEGNFDRRAFLTDIAKLGNGAAIMAVGTWLYAMGMVRMRPDDDDKDKKLLALEKVLGKGKYQLNLSAVRRFFQTRESQKENEMPTDEYASLDWFAPVSILMIAGIKSQQVSKGKKAQRDYENLPWYEKVVAYMEAQGTGLFEGVSEQLNTVLELPMMQTLNSFKYAEDVSDYIGIFLSGLPNRLLAPAPLKYAKELSDEYARDTYTDGGLLSKTFKNLQVKLPVVSKNLYPKVDMFGNDVKQYPTGNSVGNVFFNPAYMNTYTTDPEALKLEQIYNRFKTQDHLPPAARKKWTIKKKDYPLLQEDEKDIILTPQEYYNYQVAYGKKVKEIVRDNLEVSDDEKMQDIINKRVAAQYDKARKQVEEEILRARGLAN